MPCKQNDQDMVSAGERLYSADRRAPPHPAGRPLGRRGTPANATAKRSRRGRRISKPDDRTHVDGVIVLAMAVERAEFRREPVKLLGWL